MLSEENPEIEAGAQCSFKPEGIEFVQDRPDGYCQDIQQQPLWRLQVILNECNGCITSPHITQLR